MTVDVKTYLEYFEETPYPGLFDQICMQGLERVKEVYGELETEETILEIRLSETDRQCDYSIRVDIESQLVKEYWYELDADVCVSKEIVPCYFIDAAQVKPGRDNEEFYNTALVGLAGKERVSHLKPMLEKCVSALEGKCPCLFQLGAMTGRNQMDSIRLFTEDMTRPDVIEYLGEIGWSGDLDSLDQCLEELEKYSDKKQFIIDFDIYESFISEKIGINMGTRAKSPAVVEQWLCFLEEKGWCLPGKKMDVMRFIETFPSHDPFIQNDISHFKLPFEQGKVTMAKAYLRQGSKCFYPEFKAYFTPQLMNLELTNRCPLRCPQCYCDLAGGKDMDLDTALYWIKEAAKCRVKTVNLSGGETLCYPFLTDLVKACGENGMEANIAVSGYNINREKIKELIESGVADICVSLNGSTKEINEKSRDGYELAIHALEVLKELNYQNTCINWVMHSHNAEDFVNMLELAERYQVRTLVVMVFKPDASNQLPSVPTKEQVRQTASIIKKYKGSVKIEAEECFSQMRALLGEKFFFNTNRGISKGCGAGRDGISISVDGKLTPCRHLELKEEYLSIKEYWEQSEILKKLRNVEENKCTPCKECRYNKNCLPCMAVNWKTQGEIFMGDSTCPLAE